MATFVAAYLVIWLAVVLYVARLGAGQRRLQRDLEALKSGLKQREDPQPPVSRAA